MRKISLLTVLFVLSISLNAFMSKEMEKNYAKSKRAFSEEDFNLINKKLDNHVFAAAIEIRGELKKLELKKKVFFWMLLML
ncbi:exported protein A EppA [Borreliella valaisiana]|nr:exported protein A EppA [Borreliella valaisiana]